MEKEKKEKKPGRKFLKIFLISLGSLLGLAVVVICVALWLVFTPARITPIINKQIPKFISADAGIERAELTFFSSFPVFGIKADGVRLANPVEGAPCDEVVNVKTLRAAIDIKAFLKRDELILSDIVLKDGTVCAYIDAQGTANFDVLPEDTNAANDEESEFTLAYVDLDDVRLENIDLTFRDDQSGMRARAKGLSARVKGAMRNDAVDALATLSLSSLDFEIDDEKSPIKAVTGAFSAEVKAKMDGDLINGATLKIMPFTAVFDYGENRFLDNAEISLDADVARGDLAKMFFDLRSANAKVNGLGLALNGSVELGDSTVTTDLAYKFTSWPLTDIVALIPASFSEYIQGIEIEGGTLSSEGTVKGVMKDSTQMPVIDIRLMAQGVAGAYPELLPVKLKSLDGNIHAVTDLMNDETSVVEIESLTAHTPRSSVKIAGNVGKLFSDMHFRGTATADVDLAEFAPLLPDTVKAEMKGRARLSLTQADVSMAQIEAMALEKMKVAGTLELAGMDAVYDTITLRTGTAKIGFSMPNANPRVRNLGFAGIDIKADDIFASMGGMSASLTDTDLFLHTSDIRDTATLPAMRCEFGFGHINAGMEGISANVDNPSGIVLLAQTSRRSAAPRFGVTFKSDTLSAVYEGDNYSYDKINLRANVTYNEKEEELFLKFLPRGSIDLVNAKVNMKAISDPIEVPTVKMDFNPFDFNIEHTNVNIGKSDFSLQGRLSNIMPYFKGDSILRGEFNFDSRFTDIGALMALTSADTAEEEAPDAGKTGKGAAEDKQVDGAEDKPQPFLVPKNTDITLHANIDKAVMMQFFADTLSSLKGDIQVIDSKLIMDGLRFSSPLTAMQLTAIYRSVRPDHLYAYLDFHLLHIEVQDLLSAIPPLQEFMPMLGSFRGKGEFHLGAEVYMWDDYSIKIPTLRGAASINASEITLMDGEMFTQMLDEMGKIGGMKAKNLFKNFIFDPAKGVKFDNLSAEFVAFRDEITVYPFLLSIDKYKAVLGGHHNIDMNYDYTLSLVESPLPFRMSIEVADKGKGAEFSKFKLKAENMDVYRPESRKAVESQTMQLRKIIREATASTVRPWDEEDLKRMEEAK